MSNQQTTNLDQLLARWAAAEAVKAARDSSEQQTRRAAALDRSDATGHWGLQTVVERLSPEQLERDQIKARLSIPARGHGARRIFTRPTVWQRVKRFFGVNT
jgi:phage gp37-like protein